VYDMTTPRIEEMRSRVGEIIGEASMCWSETPTGIFNSEKSVLLVDEIVTALTQAHQAGREEALEKVIEKALEIMKEERDYWKSHRDSLTKDAVSAGIMTCQNFYKALNDTIKALQDNK
jgi:hypothetical protein